jgi:formate dehydrogenase major subunit
MSVLNNYMFGYCDYPLHTEPTLVDWTRHNGTIQRAMAVNGLKAWFGENAEAANEFCYGWLPKRSAKTDYSAFGIVDAAHAGSIRALWVLGQNPLVTSPNLNYVQEAFAKLELLVVQELWETETAAFWQAPGVDPKSIQTEVLLLPAAYFMEKEGTISNSGGMVQWRYAGVKPPGQARPDIEIIDEVFRRVRDLYHESSDPKDAPILRAAWSYRKDTLAEDVLKEINGRAWSDLPEKGLKAGDLVRAPSDLAHDGATSSGAWIYAGCFAGGENLTKRRKSKDPSGLGLNPGYAWTWPSDMKILYNRASCDAEGRPMPARDAKGNILAPAVPLIAWDPVQKRWTGIDTPDVRDPRKGPGTPEGLMAFRGNPEGVGRLLAGPYEDPKSGEKGLPATWPTFPRTDRSRSSTSRWRARSRTRCTPASRATPPSSIHG